MRKSIAVIFGMLMFALGAYSGLGAQPAAPLPGQYTFEAFYVPEVPKVGQQIEFRGGGRCRVTAVAREWVRCAEAPQWRNLYNGQIYGVYDSTQ